jgi:hypothetical protein
MVLAVAAEEPHLGDPAVCGHHHRLAGLGVAERHVALAPRLASPVQPEHGARGPLEAERLLCAGLPRGLGQVDDLREEPALTETPHELGLQKGGYGRGGAPVALVLDRWIGDPEEGHRDHVVGLHVEPGGEADQAASLSSTVGRSEPAPVGLSAVTW